jgi:hypothetical protein
VLAALNARPSRDWARSSRDTPQLIA